MENDILGDFACNVNIISNIIYFTHLPLIVLFLKGTCNTGLYNGLVIYIYSGLQVLSAILSEKQKR